MSRQSNPGVALRRIWRAIVPPALRRLGQGAAIALARRRVAAALADGEPAFSPGPVIVSGLLSGASGVSRAARLTLRGIQQAGYQPMEHDLAPLFAGAGAGVGQLPAAPAGGVWILHVNAPEGLAAMSRIAPDLWRGRYRIGVWAYELPVLPASWAKTAAFFHELWVPSQFIADAATAAGVATPLRVMPHPVALANAPRPPQPQEGPFTVLVMGDLQSSWTRKNLIGAIEIFKRAFPKPTAVRRLIVKVQSAGPDPKFEHAARNAVAGRSDIAFLNERMSHQAIDRLIAGCSVFLSPHRSEGFGLVIAEAFLAGVPTLATGWSGNLDFMADVPELCIGHHLVPVQDAGGVYRASGALWAEPDLDDAAHKLRALEASNALRRELAARGRAAVIAQAEAWTRSALDETRFGHYAGPDSSQRVLSGPAKV